jgi:hypothetical protein
MSRGEIAFAGGANPSEIVECVKRAEAVGGLRRSGKRTFPVSPAKARVQSLPPARTARLLERSRASFPAFVGMTNERLILEVAIRSR